MKLKRSPAPIGRTLLLCTVSALAFAPHVLHAQGLLGDINGSTTGGVTPAANTWQQYSYTFTATLPSTYITFLFKNNPNITSLDDISLALTSGGSNLLLNPGLETAGTVTATVTIPADWGSVGTPGLRFPGSWLSTTTGNPGDSRSHTGTGVWADGAISGYDGITQAATTTVGQSYTLTFWEGSGTVPDGTSIDSQVFAGLNIDTLQPSYGSSQIGVTVNPIFAGGTLQLDQVGASHEQDFTLDGSGTNTIDQNGNTGTFSGTFSDSAPGTHGALTIANGSSGGSVILTGVSTYTGATTINPGATLTLSGAGSIAASSGLTDNGTFDISGSKSGASIATLSGGGIVTLGGQTLTLTNASDTFSGVIGGTGGLTVSGGTERLSGVNLYTGLTTINGGATLALSGTGSIAASSGVVDNGTFDISATKSGASITTLSGSGGVTLGGRSLTLTAAEGTFSGVIGGTGGLTVSGGSETLTGVNTYTGATTIGSGATLTLSGGGGIAGSGVADDGTFSIADTTAGAAITALSGGGIVTLGGQTLTLTKATGNFSGVIGGTGGLTVSGGTATLGGVNTYTGATGIGSGATLALSGSGSIAASSGVANDGTFSITGTTAGASVVTLSGIGTVTLGAQTLTLTKASGTLSGVIGGTGGLTVSGGSETLTGINTYTGATAIGSGATLTLSGGGSIAGSAVADDGTFDIAGTTSGATITALSGGGIVTLGAQSLTLTKATGSFSGVIGGTGGLTVSAGTATLGGVNTYTGATGIGSGATLALSGSGSIAASSGVANDGTFSIAGATAGASIVTLSGSGTVSLGSQNLTLTKAGGVFAGGITGVGNLTIAAGTETLSGVSSFTGITTVSSGATLALSGSGSIAGSSVANDGAFDIAGASGTASIGSLLGSGSVTLGANTLRLTNALDTFGGVIAGSGGFTVAGGVEILSGVNTYTGTTTIDDGASLALSDGSIAASSGVVNNGSFAISLNAGGASIATLSGTGQVLLGNQTLTLTNASTTFAGALTDSLFFLGGGGGIHGKLTVAAGTQTLTGTNSYTGATTIDPGAALNLAGIGSIAFSVGVADNGSFDISATDAGAAITTLSGTGVVTLGAQTLTLTNAASTFAGVIGGTGGITIGSGTETLSGANTYTGTTTISTGTTLALSGGGSIAASSVSDDGTLDISGTTSQGVIGGLSGGGTVTLGSKTLRVADSGGFFSGVIAGTGGLSVGGGTQVLSGVNTYTGITTIDGGGELFLSGAGSIATTAGVVANGLFNISPTGDGATVPTLSGSGFVALGRRTLTLSNAGGTFSGVISDALIVPTFFVGGSGGSLVVAAGTETLTGGNTYTGTTTVNPGATLNLAGTGSIALSAGVVDNGLFDITATDAGASIKTLSGNGIVALGAQTLTLTAASGTFSGTIGGSGGMAVIAGTETLTGSSTYTGGTTVSGATLAINADAALGSGGGLSLSDGTLRALAALTSARPVSLGGTAGSVDTNGVAVGLSGVLSGSGGLIATGGGVLTLGGADTYTGATTIVSGTTLVLSGAGSIAASSGVADAGGFDISGISASGTAIATLSGAGTVALGGKTLTLANAADTFTGTIGGSGGLTIAGGTETLTASNTYTGASTIGAGATLALTGSGSIFASGVVDAGTFTIAGLSGTGTSVTSLSGGGGVVLGSKTLTLTNAGGTFSGVISGTGGLALTGGTEALTGSNTYTGGTAVSNATLAVNADAALGAASGGLSLSGGTLQALASFASARAVALTGSSTVSTGGAGNTVTLSGVVSGSGSLTANGGGRVNLSGVANSYAGGTTISGGTTVGISSDTALGATGTGLTFDNGTLLALGGFSTPRPILVTTGGGNVDANGFIVLLTGPITLNGALNSIGSGRVSFSNNAEVNGDLNIGNGTFSNSGTINALSVTVGTDGTLRGTGTINAPTTISGTLAPGNSPGTLTFTDPLVLTAGSTSQFDIDGTGTGTGAGNFSRALVTGTGNTATVAGTLVPLLRGITGDATNTYTPPIGQTFVVMSATGGILGSYAGLTQPAGLGAGTRFDSIYGSTTLTLVITPAQYGNLGLAGLAETANQAVVGSALDAIRPAAGVRMSSAAAALFNPLYQLSGPAIAPVLDQLAPTIYGDGLLAAREAWYQVADSVTDQLAARRNRTAAANTAPGPLGSTIWVNGMGQFGHVNGSAVPGYNTSFGGAIAGIDFPVLQNAVLGVAVGGGSLNTTTSNGSNDDASLVQFSAYGGVQYGLFFADAQADYIHVDRSVRRSLSTFGTSARGNGSIDGGGAQAHAGVRLEYGRWQLEPTIGLGVTNMAAGSLTELGGGGLAEQIGSQSVTSLQSLVGLRIGTSFDIATATPLRVHALLGWQHEFLDTTARVTAAFGLGGGGSFVTSTAPISRDAARIGAGFDVVLSERVSLYGSYTAALGSASTAQNLTGGVRVVW